MTITQTELGLLVATIALLGVVLGGLVAGGFALLTGWLDDRRQHRRWVNEKRYASYVKLAGAVDRLALFGDSPPAIAATAELNLLGPDWLFKKSENFMQAARTLNMGSKVERSALELAEQSEAYNKARSHFVIYARFALGIPSDGGRRPRWERDIDRMKALVDSFGSDPSARDLKKLRDRLEKASRR